MRRIVLLVVLLLIAAPAAAQSTGEISDGVRLRGYYSDGEADVSIGDLESLVDRYPAIAFVAIETTPSGGADALADQVLDASPRDTVIVLTADEAGGASRAFDDARMDAAFDAAFSSPGDTYLRDFEEVATALSDAPVVETPTQPAGGARIPWTVIIVVGGVGFLAYRMWTNRRADERAVERRFGEAREEIEAQMAVIANQILAVSDRVTLAEDPRATGHYRRASDVYRDAEERLAAAVGTADFEALADDLDDARWELAATEAVLDGEPVPDRPEETPPEPCFFDPTHGAGTEEAVLETAAGTRSVRVCTADADRLRRGEKPEPRTVSVDGRAVPAPSAPRSHGGRGMDAMDVFSILVGGMGNAASYRWGRTAGRRSRMPRMPGGFGGGMGRARTRRTTGRASAPRSRSSTGRARRGR